MLIDDLRLENAQLKQKLVDLARERDEAVAKLKDPHEPTPSPAGKIQPAKKTLDAPFGPK